MLGLGQELNMEAACSCANELKEIKKEHALCEEKGEGANSEIGAAAKKACENRLAML